LWRVEDGLDAMTIRIDDEGSIFTASPGKSHDRDYVRQA
jgi:hypothetical protein